MRRVSLIAVVFFFAVNLSAGRYPIPPLNGPCPGGTYPTEYYLSQEMGRALGVPTPRSIRHAGETGTAPEGNTASLKTHLLATVFVAPFGCTKKIYTITSIVVPSNTGGS
uniref:Uncharacterized protein n=1 Tax=Magallana gigas TaxID=29159 RepID=K1R5M4_MAGGI